MQTNTKVTAVHRSVSWLRSGAVKQAVQVTAAAASMEQGM